MSFWYDQQHDLMVYDTHLPDESVQFYQGAVRLHNGYLAVPANLYNCQVSQHLKLPIIPIIDRDYDYPIRKPWRPRDHQRVMANFMVANPRCFNLSDMGTMKTLPTLWAADYLMTKNPGMKAIVVAPLSTLQRVWGDALTQHFLGRRSYAVVHGDAKKRSRKLAENVDFYLINHDGVGVGAKVKKHKLILEGLSDELKKRSDIQIVIIDEASAYRDGGTRRHRVMRAVLADRPYFWPLTGTPTSNGPLDAHGLARLVNGAFGESFNSYKTRVMYKVSDFTWLPRVGANQEAHKLLQPSIRYEMRECTDVPPCTEQMRDVELSAEQAKLIKELKRDLTIQLEKGIITAVNEAALRLKLIQISCGAVYDSNHRASRVDCAPRLAVLREVIEEAARKVIIFTPLTSIVHMLYEELDDYSRAMINGEVPLKVRDEIFRRFQTEADPQILIADPATMSHGLDLFAASVVCWYGATDKTELYLQANRRIDRPGQSVPTTIVQLAATPTEREIFRRAASNTSMQGAILDLVRNQ
ncbi:MAG: DEAD/DEAH box helicase [Bradyrhizobium sp.]|nr:DEAD/DEAH box helicase [Bradyrhizobium sp.]